MLGLGRSYDIPTAFKPTDVAGSTPGGIGPFSLRDAGGVDLVMVTADGVAGDDIDFTIKRHVDLDDASGTTIALGNLSTKGGHKYFYRKSHATDVKTVGTWTRVEYGDADGVFAPLDADSGEASEITVIHISAAELGDGYSALSVSWQDVGSGGAKLLACIPLLVDLKVQRAPQNLRSQLVA